MTNDAGKGDTQRPIQDQQQWDLNYERMLGVLRDDWPQCNECGEPIIFDEDEPFAYCSGECGWVSEWGDEGRPNNWKVRQRNYLRRKPK